MDTHAKILATLWIAVVVMWALFWITPDHWTSEFGSKRKRKILRWYTRTTLVVSAVAVVDAVLYGLLWVWG